jgi:hypothetical protein
LKPVSKAGYAGCGCLAAPDCEPPALADAVHRSR